MHTALMKQIGWKVEGELGSRIFYRPFGPICVAKLQRPKNIDLDWVNKFRRYHHTLTTYLEPGLTTKVEGKVGMIVDPFAHSATSLVDLTGSEKEILASFSQKTRYNIVHSVRKNELKITTTPLSAMNHKQLTDFYALHDSWSKDRKVFGYPRSLLGAIFKCFADCGQLHLTYLGSALVGALLTLSHEGIATYYAAFATPVGYKSFAPTLLTWTAMQTARANGADIFDFGGIFDPRYPKMYKKWQGFTKFKSGFHPTVVLYPQTTLKLFW